MQRFRPCLAPMLTTRSARRRPDQARSSIGKHPLRNIMALMLREMVSVYGHKPGGYLWAVAQPIGGIALLAVGFSLVLRTPPLGTSFILFFATGVLPYAMFAKTSRTVSRALVFSRNLLVFPVVGWAEAIIARFILNSLVQFIVSVIVISAILIVTETSLLIEPVLPLISMFLAGLLGLGVGLLNAVLIGFFPIWENIWGIATRPLFLASGIVFLYEDMPQLAQDIIWWNPLVHVTSISRDGFYPLYEAPFVSYEYLVGVCLLLITLGLIFMRKHNLKILNRR